MIEMPLAAARAVQYDSRAPECACGRAREAVFGGIRAPSTLGSFLRAFTWGTVDSGLVAPKARPRTRP